MAKKKILVVANRTAYWPDLIDALRGRAAEEPIGFTLLVPAAPRGFAGAADMESGWSAAALRADRVGGRIRESGLELEEVIIGDPNIDLAVGDVLHARELDEVMFESEADREPVAA